MTSFGWIKDFPDDRDWLYTAPAPPVAKLAVYVDLRDKMPPIWDQGSLGSCTAQATSGASAFLHQAMAHPLDPSRLFNYWEARAVIGTTGWDSGATIRDSIKVLAKFGACPESMWPYVPFRLTDKPTQDCYDSAIKHKALAYRRLPRVNTSMQSVLAKGYPFVFGFVVYESFINIGADGMMPTPKPNERVLGGHAVLAVGYDAKKQFFIARNSWGSGWGDHGHFYVPFSIMVNRQLTDDRWVVTVEE